MVQLLLEALGGDRRRPKGAAASENARSAPENQPVQCYHVDSRLSGEIKDIGRIRWGKPFRILKYCLEAIWFRFRYGVKNFYYVPAPGLRSAIYRDWIVMALCRPFFQTIILHWHAVGLGAWLETDARPLERWVTRLLLCNSDLSIVLGPFYESDVAKLAPKRVESVPNGIPDPCPFFDKEVLPRRLARAAARARLLGSEVPAEFSQLSMADDPQIFRVLYLSLCLREKGIFDTLEAVALANRKLSEQNSPLRIHLSVAGKFWDEREREEFNERIARTDLNGSDASRRPTVRFHGFVSRDEKDQLLRESDCFCFPTYYSSEGHPVSLLEAMAYGLPIITTRWRAVPELFPTGFPGLVEPRAPEQVAGVLQKFIREDYERSSRQTFQEKFMVARFAERITAALLTVAKQT